MTALLAQIAAVNLLGEPIRFGLEATGHYWLALYSQLTHAGHEVIIINPIKTSAQRKLRIRPVKNDRIDARTIADIILERFNGLPERPVAIEAL